MRNLNESLLFFLLKWLFFHPKINRKRLTTQICKLFYRLCLPPLAIGEISTCFINLGSLVGQRHYWHSPNETITSKYLEAGFTKSIQSIASHWPPSALWTERLLIARVCIDWPGTTAWFRINPQTSSLEVLLKPFLMLGQPKQNSRSVLVGPFTLWSLIWHLDFPQQTAPRCCHRCSQHFVFFPCQIRLMQSNAVLNMAHLSIDLLSDWFIRMFLIIVLACSDRTIRVLKPFQEHAWSANVHTMCVRLYCLFVFDLTFGNGIPAKSLRCPLACKPRVTLDRCHHRWIGFSVPAMPPWLNYLSLPTPLPTHTRTPHSFFICSFCSPSHNRLLPDLLTLPPWLQGTPSSSDELPRPSPVLSIFSPNVLQQMFLISLLSSDVSMWFM